jgi:hypothetical protein
MGSPKTVNIAAFDSIADAGVAKVSTLEIKEQRRTPGKNRHLNFFISKY